jgi:predicted dehydrogenase
VSTRYSLGIVGIGAIGGVHLDTASALPEARVAGVCDARGDLAAAAAQRTGARAYADYRKLGDEERLDGVVVCTPPVTHPEIARFFLERGVDVLCEKPLAVDAQAADGMYRCARRHRRTLVLASKFRYVEGVVTARELLREGVLGSIRHAEIVFVSNVDMRSRWNSDPKHSGGGVVIDNGGHAADICRYLFGPVVSVAAVAYTRVAGLAVEDSAYLYLGTQHGTGVTVDISWSLDRRLPYYIRIYGERGRMCVGWNETTLALNPSIAVTQVAPGYSKAEAFCALQRDFIAASSGKGPGRIDADDGLASVEVIDAAYDAIREGGRRAVA